MQNRVVDKYISIIQTEDNPAATRGFSLALGHLPAKLLAPSRSVLDLVLNCLCGASRKESLIGGESDAETRRNAIISLVKVCTEVGIGKPVRETVTFPVYRLTRNQTGKVFRVLLAAMEDYNTDRRGDVGSWSRIAAMDGLETLTYLSIRASDTFPHSFCQTPASLVPLDIVIAPSFNKRMCTHTAEKSTNFQIDYDEDHNFFDDELCCLLLSTLLKQLGEKLDVVRCKAGECLERLLINSSPRLPFVPHRERLVRALSLREQSTNWADPAITFPLVMRVVNIDEFIEPILSGIVISVGGLTESVSKSSSAALFEWIRELRSVTSTQKIFRMGEGEINIGVLVVVYEFYSCHFLLQVFLGLFRKYKRNTRVLIPLLSTLDKLLSHGYLNELLCSENGEFCSKLVACITSEAKGCDDIKLLLAIIGVSFALLEPHVETIPTVRLESAMHVLVSG